MPLLVGYFAFILIINAFLSLVLLEVHDAPKKNSPKSLLLETVNLYCLVSSVNTCFSSVAKYK